MKLNITKLNTVDAQHLKLDLRYIEFHEQEYFVRYFRQTSILLHTLK